MLCSLHLCRNLKDKRYGTKVIELFKTAAYAKSRGAYDDAMNALKVKSAKAFEDLTAIEENWQLFKAVDMKRPLFGMLTNNIVEQTFAWLLEERFLNIGDCIKATRRLHHTCLGEQL